MKEVTYEDWQKNPTPRMMWVWDDIESESEREKLKVLYILSKEEYPDSCFRVISITNGIRHAIRLSAHCAEIEKQRRMTNQELSRWLREKPTREFKYNRCDNNCIYSYFHYYESTEDKEVDDAILIREDDGDWKEPLVEVIE